MPPRKRTTKKKEDPAVSEETITEAAEAVAAVDGEQPKKRGGRKRSELAHAAREYEKWSNVVTTLEIRYARIAEKLSEVTADLERAREERDKAHGVLDKALDAATITPEDL